MEVFSGEGHNPVERIYFLKREVLQVHAALGRCSCPSSTSWPIAASSSCTKRCRSTSATSTTTSCALVDKVNQFSDMLSSVLAANLTQVGVRQNQDMRKIAAWAAILAVPTALAGVYGMNFDHMPELRWGLGYPMALLLMFAICMYLYRRFKKSGWL